MFVLVVFLIEYRRVCRCQCLCVRRCAFFIVLSRRGNSVDQKHFVWIVPKPNYRVHGVSVLSAYNCIRYLSGSFSVHIGGFVLGPRRSRRISWPKVSLMTIMFGEVEVCITTSVWIWGVFFEKFNLKGNLRCFSAAMFVESWAFMVGTCFLDVSEHAGLGFVF